MNWKKLVWHGLFTINTLVCVGGWIWLQTLHFQQGIGEGSGQEWSQVVGDFAAGFAWQILLFTLFLIARNPYFETVICLSRKVWMHRLILFLVAGLIIVHVAAKLSTIVETGNTTLFSIELVNRFIEKYPSVEYALFALVLFVPVIGCAQWNSLKQFHFEWYIGIRMLLYPVFILIFLHLLYAYWNQPMDGIDALYQVYLLILSSLVVVYFFFWRIVFPIFGLVRHHYRLDHVEIEQPGIVSWYVRGRHLTKLPYKPGQFFLVRPLTEGNFIENHPFILSILPTSRSFRFTIAAVGDFTAEADQLLEHTALMLEGPFGHWTPEAARYDYAILVGQGIALAGLRPLAEGLLYDGVRVKLVCFAPEGEKILFHNEFVQLQKRWDDRLDLDVLENTVLSPETLAVQKIEWKRSTVFLCGPDARNEVVLAYIRSCGVSTRDLCLEPW